MQITAVNKFTLLDYPGKIAAIIFTAGCNMRCGYCHNSQFVLPEKIKELSNHFIPFKSVVKFLKSRQEFIDGVVISGGEPTIQIDLVDKIKMIKEMGFLVKIDTNGTNPSVLETLIKQKLIDYIAMDLKSSADSYNDICGTNIDIANIKKSVKLILTNKIDYEFRSTILPKYHSLQTLSKMGELIKGAKLWALQNFRNISVLDKEFKNFPEFTTKEITELQQALVKLKLVERIVVRN
jgi:pyruvate formate lyase activating enzyme